MHALADKNLVYRITGNFGGGFNLAIWRLEIQSPKKKSPNPQGSSVHAQYAMCINRQILNLSIARSRYFAKI